MVLITIKRWEWSGVGWHSRMRSLALETLAALCVYMDSSFVDKYPLHEGHNTNDVFGGRNFAGAVCSLGAVDKRVMEPEKASPKDEREVAPQRAAKKTP